MLSGLFDIVLRIITLDYYTIRESIFNLLRNDFIARHIHMPVVCTIDQNINLVVF